MDIEMGKRASLAAQARQHGIPEAETLQAWEEMRTKHRLPWYIEPILETDLIDGSITLEPAVNINLLSRAEREVPDWSDIHGPEWPAKTVPKHAAEVTALLAESEAGSPLSKFCCRLCGESAPKELLEESQHLKRLSWLKTHYETKHPGVFL